MNLLELSQKIRQLRQAQHMTLEQLARDSGFSKGFISQVENFRLSPSLKALNRIAAALGVELRELFDSGDSRAEYTFGRLDSGKELVRDNEENYGIRYLALAHPQIGRKMDPFTVVYTPGEKTRGFLTHDTEEFFVLLEGEIDFLLFDDSRRKRMIPGETLYLKANLPHRVELAPACPTARALIVYAENPEK